jgi:hypothetical protein
MATLRLLTLLSSLLARASVGQAAVSPVTTGLPGTWKYAACYLDNANGRVLADEYDSSTTTVASCIAYCSSNNFTLAGIEYSTQCCE